MALKKWEQQKNPERVTSLVNAMGQNFLSQKLQNVKFKCDVVAVESVEEDAIEVEHFLGNKFKIKKAVKNLINTNREFIQSQWLEASHNLHEKIGVHKTGSKSSFINNLSDFQVVWNCISLHVLDGKQN